MFVIYCFIRDRVHYWNTCGWTRNLMVARLYTPGEPREVLDRMARDGVRASVAPFKARAGL